MAAITTFFEHKDIYENVKPYAWDGEESELFLKTNFVLKEMEASLFDRKGLSDNTQVADSVAPSS